MVDKVVFRKVCNGNLVATTILESLNKMLSQKAFPAGDGYAFFLQV